MHQNNNLLTHFPLDKAFIMAQILDGLKQELGCKYECATPTMSLERRARVIKSITEYLAHEEYYVNRLPF